MNWARKSMVIQKPAPFDAMRLRKDLQQAGHVLAQPKLMGVHLRWDGQRLLLSGGGEAGGLPHIADELWRVLPGVDLEGEAYRHGWADEMVAGIARRDRSNLHPGYREVSFFIFDKVAGTDQHIRLAALEAIRPKIETSEYLLRLVPTVRCSSERQAYDLLSGWLAQGLEGIVLRHPLGLWKTGYSAALQKIKPGGHDVYRIVGVHGRDRFEGLVVEGQGGERFCIRAVAMSEDEREEAWARPAWIIGKLAWVRYTEAAGGEPLASAVVRISNPGNEKAALYAAFQK